MSAASVNHEEPVRCAIHPYAIFLLKFRIHAQTEICGIADLERGGRLEKRAGQEKAEEGDEPCRHERGERRPGKAPARLIDLVVFGSDWATPADAAALEVPTDGVPT